ncbi:hypothetical protein [Methylococcus mesophilus]|uniref:hypothetical protein n=1 Tax=Methylococcus mesophilus TaxID=2993564 RepID=UPI00224A6B9F|nr:hypothetical protein [Methylococcus mesophilus]UZR30738.1 hypothetical protein OOT43_08960 [Methylococcus mesophilus]
MRHFIAYHNQQKMGYSCADIPEPRVQTSREVEGLEGVTVWLVAGEGENPKAYFLAAKFVASHCERNSTSGSKFPYLIAGPGSLYKKSIPLGGTSVLAQIRKESANFVRGFYETKNPSIVSALNALAPTKS